MKWLHYAGLMMFVAGITLAGCRKDYDVEPIVTFVSTLNGANEEWPNSSAATGTATGVYNRYTKILVIHISYWGLTPTMGHIHTGPPGVSGPVVFSFPSLTSPINFTSPEFDAIQEGDLLNGLYYINLHSIDYPAGEIRGQFVRG